MVSGGGWRELEGEGASYKTQIKGFIYLHFVNDRAITGATSYKAITGVTSCKLVSELKQRQKV